MYSGWMWRVGAAGVAYSSMECFLISQEREGDGEKGISGGNEVREEGISSRGALGTQSSEGFT